jgi:hypothetical protein
MQKITYDFKKLITLIRLENEKPENKLNLVENQLKSLVMILVVWGKYTDIIYKPEEEIEAEMEEAKKTSFHTKQRLEAKSLDDLLKENNPEKIKNFYLQRITEKKGKGKGLFISEFLGLYDNPDLRRKMDKLESEEIKRINSKDFNDPKYAKLFAEEQESEALKSAKAPSSQAEKQQSSRKSAQENAEDFAIKKARSFEAAGDAKNKNAQDANEMDSKDESNNKKKSVKKERAAVESSDLKMKKKKKASISETKRKLLENEVSEVFKDEEDLSEEVDEADEASEAQKAMLTQEEIDRNRKQLEEFERAGAEEVKCNFNNKGESLVVNEKLKEYYDGIRSERLGEPLKEKKAESAQAAEEAGAAKQQKTVKEDAGQNKKTKHIAAEYLERSVKNKIDSRSFFYFMLGRSLKLILN